MPQTVRDLCAVRKDAFRFVSSDEIEDIAGLIREAGDGSEFFERNVVTKGLAKLLRGALSRLAGNGDSNAVYQLTQAMGGGKTHAMIALGLLARNPGLRPRYVADIHADTKFAGSARVVAISGRDKPSRYLWGEIANQLGRGADFERFWKEGPDAPDEKAWVEILKGEPTLILLDELPPYFDYARTRPLGDGTLADLTTYALANLLTAALKCANCCVVVSNLSGSYQDATSALNRVIANLSQEIGRAAIDIQPVDLGSDEIFHILRQRIFEGQPSPSEVARVADAYGAAIEDAERGSTISRSAERVAQTVSESYPFHPGLRDVLALFKGNDRYKQTRGVIRLVARLVKCVWDRPANDVHLIGAQHFDLSVPEVKNIVLEIADLDGAITKDIAAADGQAHAQLLDVERDNDVPSQIGRLLLFSSLSSAVDGVKGLPRQTLVEFLIVPDRPASEIAAAFDEMKAACWYLHPGKNERWYFSNDENLKKRLQTEAAAMQQTKVTQEMRRRLNSIFAPKNMIAYQEVVALPDGGALKAVSDKRTLFIISPDSRQPPEDVSRFHEHIVDKNAVAFLTGDGDSFTNLDQTTRDILAIEKLKGEIEEGHPKFRELEERAAKAEVEFNGEVSSLVSRFWYPVRKSLQSAKVSLTLLKGGTSAEDQIEGLLSSAEVAKLHLDVEKAYDTLVDRAEDVLFGGLKDMPKVDLRRRAASEMRWPWLPPKGLDDLIRIAAVRGRWRDVEGRILVGPFDAERTSVKVEEEHFDDRTGTAKLRIVAQNAGRSPVVRWSDKGEPGPTSDLLQTETLETTATRLWFVAEDPNGKHETGPSATWRTKLAIRYEIANKPGGGRTVELQVTPRGAMTYTVDGTNARDGTSYAAPFDVPDREMVLSVHATEGDVETSKEFRIAARQGDGSGPRPIDPVMPLVARADFRFETPVLVFAFLGDAAVRKAKLREVRIAVGSGSANISAKVGSGVSLTAERVEAVIGTLRDTVGSAEPEVEIGLKEIAYASGQDFTSSLKVVGIEIDDIEVEQ